MHVPIYYDTSDSVSILGEMVLYAYDPVSVSRETHLGCEDGSLQNAQ